MTARLRIFLADDHAVVREGLRSLVGAQADMEVIGEAADGVTAVAESMHLAPDVVVMDISMPGMNGVRATEDITGASPSTKVLAHTVHEDQVYIRRILGAGASGYVLKRSAAEEMIRAIRTIAAGGVYIDPALASMLLAGLVAESGSRPRQEPRGLSEREEEIFRLVARGFTGKEIAARLDISAKTVETHKSRAMEKLGLTSRADAVRFALLRGWLDDA